VDTVSAGNYRQFSTRFQELVHIIPYELIKLRSTSMATYRWCLHYFCYFVLHILLFIPQFLSNKDSPVSRLSYRPFRPA